MTTTADPALASRRARDWARKAIPELDGLRGLAIALVYCFHAHGFVVAGAPIHQRLPLHLIFIYGGHTGVSLFFVLSAYLLSRPFLASLDGAPAPHVLRFYRRRALRILPLYWVAVIATAATAANSWADIRAALPFLAFLQGFPDLATPILARGSSRVPLSTPWWSLATEVQFYAVLPLLGLWTGPPERRRVGIALGLACLALWAGFVCGAWGASRFAGQWLLSSGIVGRFPVFVAGILVAWIDLRFGDGIRARFAHARGARAWLGDAVLAFAAIGLAASLRWSFYQGPFLRELPPLVAWRAAEGLLWGLALLSTLWLPSLGRAILGSRVFGWLGVQSYSIYLLHCPLILYGLLVARAVDPARFGGPSDAAFALLGALTALCLGVAALTHRFVEQPFLRLRA